MKYCLVVNENLEYELWSLGKEVKKGNFVLDEIPSLPSHLNSIALLRNLVFYLKRISSGENHKPLGNPNATEEAIEILECSNYGTNSKIAFIMEQLTLVSNKPTARIYSSSYLASCYTKYHQPLTNIYRAKIFLPCLQFGGCRQLTTAIDSALKLGETATNYLKARNSKLVPKDRIVSLIIDEVYTQKKVEYANGKFYGMETLICLMIRSIAGSYRDIIAMCPITNLNAKLQKEIWFKNVKILEDLVFEVLVTLTDGNEVNHKFFKEILMSNILQDPFNTSRLMFFGFDPVLHLIPVV